MPKEKNQSIEGFKLHDVIAVVCHQRTGENGKKKGYSWHEEGTVGVITSIEIKGTSFTYKKADGTLDKYDQAQEDDDYYYTLAISSDIEYENEIKKHIADLIKKRDQKNEEIAEATEWLYTFQQSISVMYKIINFVKSVTQRHGN